MLKFLTDKWSYMMPRPKGSKNKSVSQEPVVFDYENEEPSQINQEVTAASDAAYKAQAEYDFADEEGLPSDLIEFSDERALPPKINNQSLYFIEGNIRLEQVGSEPVSSDQTRIVWGNSLNEALNKYATYFHGMSNANQRYTVVEARGTEALR
jgi:hypothetical protein